MWDNKSGFIASSLHKRAEELRENDQLDEALLANNQAIEEYRENNNWEGVARALQSRVLIYKHKYLLIKDLKSINLARMDANESLKIADNHKLDFLISSCSFRLGEISMIAEDFGSAAKYYRKSVNEYVGSEAERGDYVYHLGEALYRSGDKIQGKKLLLAGLFLIQNNRNEVDSFLIHVWESGCYMRLADVLKNDDLNFARKCLMSAKTIIDSDPKLVIRKRQWEELADSFK